MGQIVNAPAASIADLCVVQLQDTKLQNACATPGIHQAIVLCCRTCVALAFGYTSDGQFESGNV